MTTTTPRIFTIGGYQETSDMGWIAYYSVYRGVPSTGQADKLADLHQPHLATESEARQWLAARILEDTK